MSMAGWRWCNSHPRHPLTACGPKGIQTKRILHGETEARSFILSVTPLLRVKNSVTSAHSLSSLCETPFLWIPLRILSGFGE